jgi:hypothetical protein
VRWETVLDTRMPRGRCRLRSLRGGESYDLEARSLALLRLSRNSDRRSRERAPTRSTMMVEPENGLGPWAELNDRRRDERRAVD